MKVIWKYLIEPGVKFIEMPAGAIPLSVQVQDGSPQLWAMVDQTKPMEKREFRVFGTGHEIQFPYKLSFIGTFQLSALVFHLFEVLP